MLIELQIDTSESPEPDSIIAWAEWASGEILDLPALNPQTELSIQVLDEAAMQTLNHQFRDKNKPTNVLSFPYEPMPGVTLDLLGDIALCAPVIQQEAAEQGKSLMDHWAHMLVHGMLHLRGFDHIDDEEAEVMEALEIELLAKHGIQNPYER